MGAVKANNNKDTYKATAVAFIVIGTLFLINKLLPFASIGLPWVMNKDNLLLYASISFSFSSVTSRSALCCWDCGW